MSATTSQRPRLRLGNYEPLLELASGGMATVYIARQIGAAGFERLVVIKRVHRHHLGNREFYRMFLDEARVASLVRHPNVVPVIDTVEQEGELFLVMEYVESTALSTLLKTSAKNLTRVPVPIACRMLADMLAGLHAAHEAVDMRGMHLELVHRDVSPQNVVVGTDGGSRLIDFGVAKAAHRLTETKSGSLKGKLAYMSPEQAMGHEVDRRVDIFAAGVLLHEALTGRRLFQGENDLDTMRRITEMPVPDPSTVAPGISRALDAVVQRSLQRDPAMRFQTAAQFLEALEAAIIPASPREVSAFMLSMCGDRIEERRARLKSIVEGLVDPLSMRLLPEIRDGSNESTVLPPAQRRRQGESESQISQIIAASTRDATVPPPRPSSKGPLVALLIGIATVGLAVCVGGVAIYVSQHKARKPAPIAATSTPAPTAPTASTALPITPITPTAPAPTVQATAATADAPKSDEVAIVIHADAPIVGVSAPNKKRVEIEGDHATLIVPPWSGSLQIDAVLEGNRAARAIAGEGSREVHVAAIASDRPRPRPNANANGTGAGGTKRSELQDNPY